jgi:hypothetical protein
MAINLKTKPGINGANMLSIPATWDPNWFRHFVNNSLKGADVRNAVGTNGITITGNISSPYATISGSGAGGGISTVASPGGTITVTNPSGPTVDIDLPASGVTAGSFTSANITVNAEGIVTAAANGSGGGGSTPFNVTPDTHAALPTGVGLGPNDEFETGTTIDTSGTRYSGATPWTAFNLSTATNSVSNGSLVFLPAAISSLSINGYSQPVPAGNWTYEAKIQGFETGGSQILGMFVATSAGATGKLQTFHITTQDIQVDNFNSATSFSGGASSVTGAYILLDTHTETTIPVYLQISLAGTTLNYAYSLTGIPGTFTTILSTSTSTFLGAAPALIGLMGLSQTTAQSTLLCDWFRRTA